MTLATIFLWFNLLSKNLIFISMIMEELKIWFIVFGFQNEFAKTYQIICFEFNFFGVKIYNMSYQLKMWLKKYNVLDFNKNGICIRRLIVVKFFHTCIPFPTKTKVMNSKFIFNFFWSRWHILSIFISVMVKWFDDCWKIKKNKNHGPVVLFIYQVYFLLNTCTCTDNITICKHTNHSKHVSRPASDLNIMSNRIPQPKNVCAWVGDINAVRDEESEPWMS